MNKQAGSVSANVDASERTVIEDLPGHLRRDDLRIVGRLDKDTTGLLLLTNDGDLLHRLTHPRHGTEKVYVLTFEGTLDVDTAARFEAGLTLDDGTLCAPAKIAFTGQNAAEVRVHEGKYHQVKRMIAACGGRVTRLERTQMGPLALGADLPRGATRRLTDEEIAALDEAVSGTL
jgi:16S rRNA pseudouridine516 synthase